MKSASSSSVCHHATTRSTTTTVNSSLPHRANRRQRVSSRHSSSNSSSRAHAAAVELQQQEEEQSLQPLDKFGWVLGVVQSREQQQQQQPLGQHALEMGSASCTQHSCVQGLHCLLQRTLHTNAASCAKTCIAATNSDIFANLQHSKCTMHQHQPYSAHSRLSAA